MRAHVIGAGLAGLSAAIELARAGYRVALSDGAAQAGGRCRSYHDPQMGRVIDNGNHLVLSGNDAVMAYLGTIGAADRLTGPREAVFAFVDVAGLYAGPVRPLADGAVPMLEGARSISPFPGEGRDPALPAPDAASSWTPAFAGEGGSRGEGGSMGETAAIRDAAPPYPFPGEGRGPGAVPLSPFPGEGRGPRAGVPPLPRWTFRPNGSRLPWWIWSRKRRLPGTRAADYLRFGGLLTARAADTLADRVPMTGKVWSHLLDPVFVSALNTPSREASATLAAAIVKGSLLRGGKASMPRIAHPTLAATFIDPALAWLAVRGGRLDTGRRLRAIGFEGDRVTHLDFADGRVAVAPDEPVVLAVPAWVAADLVPDLTVPNDFRAIVNAHFALAPPPGTAPMIGVIGGMAEWIFAFDDRLSVTVSAADDLIDADREALARAFWAEISAVHALPPELPRWQIVKEKRATFAATPDQDARRPGAATRWRNLFLAGDWTQTGLPSTIEGAIRSGVTAAGLAGGMRVV